MSINCVLLGLTLCLLTLIFSAMAGGVRMYPEPGLGSHTTLSKGDMETSCCSWKRLGCQWAIATESK